MNTSLNSLVATARIADLRRAADRRRPTTGDSPSLSATASATTVIALRLADADEAHLVRWLAGVDDQPPLEGRVLLALIDGEAVAALSLLDGRVVANPFLHTSAAVALLRLRAEHLAEPGPHRRLRGMLRARLA